MTKYSYEENVVVVAATFKMKMQQIIKKKLQKKNSKTFMEHK